MNLCVYTVCLMIFFLSVKQIVSPLEILLIFHEVTRKVACHILPFCHILLSLTKCLKKVLKYTEYNNMYMVNVCKCLKTGGKEADNFTYHRGKEQAKRDH